jgi:AraC family transcriptional regulator
MNLQHTALANEKADELSPLVIRSPHGVIGVESQGTVWNGVTVRHITQRLHPAPAWQNLAHAEATVAIVLEQAGGYCEPRSKLNRPTPRDRYDAGHVVYVPPNEDLWGYSDGIEMVRDVRIRFDLMHLESLLGEDLDLKKKREPVILVYNQRITKCAQLLAEECDELAEGNQIYGESLTTALLAAVFRSSGTSKSTLTGLTRWQLRRTIEYLQEHQFQDIRLSDLASLVGLSSSQFARSFKISTGSPPHRWILESRIKRAQELMSQQRKPISVVSALTGFADQSHFTKSFRRVTGVTPAVWLRCR